MPPEAQRARLDPAERRLDTALDFQPCPACDHDFATREGGTDCHYFGCPNLPEELDVVCPTCNYNFYTDETTPACGTPPTCQFAVEEAPDRLAALEVWLEQGGRLEAPELPSSSA